MRPNCDVVRDDCTGRPLGGGKQIRYTGAILIE